ncbi:MAG: SDR family oxidoreductase [Candidatus Eremiobacteraeota bacterium]|nr:SDR family oxidoreductase [Candidatus Eremiobacteraeota bacterium]
MTGAASGIAAGIAVALARDGFERVAITYRTTPPDRTLREIEAAGAQAPAARVDFSASEGEVIAALDELVQMHGPFDTLVHGVGPMVVKRFERLTMDDYREMFDGNVRSAVLAARAVLPAMREAHFGRIVVFGMNGSSETRPFRGFTLHQAAKSAVVAFARCLAVEEAARNITVNVIEPGHIRHKDVEREEALTMTSPAPRGRAGSFEDVADVVRFLVAQERDYVTGAVIAVTGGLTQADERNA